MILSISISRDATNCEIGSNIVKNVSNVSNVKNVMNVMNVRNVSNVRNVTNVTNVRNVRNAPGEEAGDWVKKKEAWRISAKPLCKVAITYSPAFAVP